MGRHYAIAIRKMAHEKKLPSVALAQAIQFETKLHQKDVIGEWVPIAEPGTPSDVIYGDMKWLRGLRWNAIDENLILRHTRSTQQRPIEIDLKLAPMVLEELKTAFCKVGEPLTRANLPASGPIIKYEYTKQPYLSYQFRRMWRIVADAAGVPPTVKNMDSRAPARLDRLAPSRRHLRKQETESAR